MNLKCNTCGRADELSPLRIGRPHAHCSYGGKWVEATRADGAKVKAKPRGGTTKRQQRGSGSGQE